MPHFLALEIEKALGIIGAAVLYAGSVWYTWRLAKSKAIDDRIKPYKDAAEGYEKAAKQLQEELVSVKKELEFVRHEYEELKLDYAAATRANFRLQGSIDDLNQKVSALHAWQDIAKQMIVARENQPLLNKP